MDRTINIDLLRLLLLEAEHLNEQCGVLINIHGHSDSEVNLAIQLLKKNGLLEIAEGANSSVFVQRITDKGSKLLHAIRKEQDLNKIKLESMEKGVGDVDSLIKMILGK
jgi:hypothetical protein